MRFSTLAVVGLIHCAGSAQAFSSLSGARFVSQRPRVLPALQYRAVNEFDAWWAVRGAQTRDAPGALPLSTDSVAVVLSEFASSDFARRLCKPGSMPAGRTCGCTKRQVHLMHHAHTKDVLGIHHAHAVYAHCTHHAHAVRAYAHYMHHYAVRALHAEPEPEPEPGTT